MIKNILNYTKKLICFAVSSLLLLSISYAVFPDNTTIIYSGMSYVNADNDFLPYDRFSLQTLLMNYRADKVTYQSDFDSFLSFCGRSNYVLTYKNNSAYLVLFPDGCDFAYNGSRFYYSVPVYNGYDSTVVYSFNSNGFYKGYFYNNPVNTYNDFFDREPYESSVSIKNCVTLSSNYGTDIECDGSYWYIATPPEPSYIPTNEEIAEKVQAFYDSDFFQNQNDFKDYFVLYNYNNETFSFIGHNLGDDIGQLIYRANFPQNTIGIEYWRFYLVDASTHIWNWFNNYYWLYSTTLDSEIITYTGKGAVTDLLELKFDPTYSTIVYSTTDYPCQIYGWDDTNHEITVESEIISGDSYTYDENIDPTTSEYNPITNYVLPNSIDTLISNADIPGLLQIWVTPDFSNMDWIFLSISAFWGYFGGFVLLTAIMFFIMWLLRGD